MIDTAPGYQGGQAERLLGEFIRADREAFVVSTKYSGGTRLDEPVTRCGNSRKTMTASLETSLGQLGLEYVDLFYVHFADGVTPTDEIMRGLDDIVRAGKARYIGFSNFPAWRIARAATLAEWRAWPAIAAIQIEYSLAERTSERELLPMAEAFGIGVTGWAALGGGLLSGKYRRNGEGRLTKGGGRVLEETDGRLHAILDELQCVADALGVSQAQVAIAWVLARGRRLTTSLIPIIGARTAGQMTENLGALTIALTAGHLERLDAVSAVPSGYPHEWLASDTVRSLATGGKPGLVDPPFHPVA